MGGELTGRTIFITGASRGIGRAMALRFAAAGANLVLAAKSDSEHATLEGTIHSVAAEVEQAGGQALAIRLDVREDETVEQAVEQAARHFGGIDALVNNASAIYMKPTEDTPLKRYDLMMDVNVRGTFSCVRVCAPYLRKSSLAHILTLSPPVNMASKWMGVSPAYAASKYGMSILALGFAREFAADGIKSNTLWPATMIDTDAIRVNFPQMVSGCRKPEIVADAAFALFCRIDPAPSGQSFTDEELLRRTGDTDFSAYAAGDELIEDIFLD